MFNIKEDRIEIVNSCGELKSLTVVGKKVFLSLMDFFIHYTYSESWTRKYGIIITSVVELEPDFLSEAAADLPNFDFSS